MKEYVSSEFLCIFLSVADWVQRINLERFSEQNSEKFSDVLLLCPSSPSRIEGHEMEMMSTVLCKLYPSHSVKGSGPKL